MLLRDLHHGERLRWSDRGNCVANQLAERRPVSPRRHEGPLRRHEGALRWTTAPATETASLTRIRSTCGRITAEIPGDPAPPGVFVDLEPAAAPAGIVGGRDYQLRVVGERVLDVVREHGAIRRIRTCPVTSHCTNPRGAS